MLYITHSQLMRESEQAVLAHTVGDDDAIRRVCVQLLADDRRYALWHSNHDRQMDGVAAARRRNAQVLKLRAVVLEQVHQTALVRYLRERQVAGPARQTLLREFHGVVDSRDATLAEHRNYLIATSTQLCATDILDLVGDVRGVDLVRRYELLYGQFFGMFCDKSRATADGEPYMLDVFLPETRDAAERLRLRILDARLAPVRPVVLATPQAKDRAPPLGVGAKSSPPREPSSLLQSVRRFWK
jgi:hypothetical protein